MVAEKCLVRQIGNVDLDNVYWLPALANSAGGMPKVKGDMIPVLRLLGSGAFHLGTPRPLKSVNPNERAHGNAVMEVHFAIEI